MYLTKSSCEWLRNNLIRDRSVPNFAVPNTNVTIRIRADDTTMTKAA